MKEKMGNKEKLAGMLFHCGEEFLSGSVIAKELGISRAGVWKNIRLLEKDGYRIEAVNNKGYRLSPDNDVVTAETIGKYLGGDGERFRIEVLPCVDSTNNYLKAGAEEKPDGSVAVAGFQTAGKGRAGRSFYSPEGTGLYLSVLLKRNISFSDAGRLTTAAAVAACLSIEECAGEQPQIKWVNDVFVRGKKVCGILTEASVNVETGTPDWLVTGIGFNVYEPEGGFPPELAGIAGAVSDKRQKELRSRLAAGFIKRFSRMCEDLRDRSLYEEYKKRCFIPGKKIFVIRAEERIPAEALDINEEFALHVRYEDGREELLTAGEVSIRPDEGTFPLS